MALPSGFFDQVRSNQALSFQDGPGVRVSQVGTIEIPKWVLDILCPIHEPAKWSKRRINAIVTPVCWKTSVAAPIPGKKIFISLGSLK